MGWAVVSVATRFSSPPPRVFGEASFGLKSTPLRASRVEEEGGQNRAHDLRPSAPHAFASRPALPESPPRCPGRRAGASCCRSPWRSRGWKFALRLLTCHRGCEWSSYLSCGFVRSAVGFSDSVVDVRFCSERLAQPLVHIVWLFFVPLSKWNTLGSTSCKPFIPVCAARSDVARLPCSGQHFCRPPRASQISPVQPPFSLST